MTDFLFIYFHTSSSNLTGLHNPIGDQSSAWNWILDKSGQVDWRPELCVGFGMEDQLHFRGLISLGCCWWLIITKKLKCYYKFLSWYKSMEIYLTPITQQPNDRMTEQIWNLLPYLQSSISYSFELLLKTDVNSGAELLL